MSTRASIMKKRKFIVKPFAPTAGLAPRAATDLWTTLKAALEKIFRHEMAALSFSELYRFAYRLMVDKQGDTVYSGVYESLSQHFQRKREEVAARPNGPAFLVSLNEVWLDSLKILHAIKDIFMYVDRTYVVQHNKKPIFARGLQVFFDAVVNSPAVRTRLRQLLQRQVLRERLGEVIDRSTMKSIMEMLVVLGPKKSVYKDFFETVRAIHFNGSCLVLCDGSAHCAHSVEQGMVASAYQRVYAWQMHAFETGIPGKHARVLPGLGIHSPKLDC